MVVYEQYPYDNQYRFHLSANDVPRCAFLLHFLTGYQDPYFQMRGNYGTLANHLLSSLTKHSQRVLGDALQTFPWCLFCRLFADIEGWNLLARSYLYIKDYQGALTAFQQIAKQLPGNADLQQQIAETQGLLDQQSSSINNIENNSTALINDQPVDVLAMVERLRKKLEVNPNQPDGWIMLGRSYKILGQLEKSLNAYQKASQLNPDNSDIKVIINELNNTLADEKNGVINKTDTNDQTPVLVRQYMQVGEFKRAIVLLEKALQQDANDIDNMIMLADALAMSNAGQFNERTQALINRALTLDSNHAVALWLAGMAEEKNQHYQGALDHWNKLLNLMSKDNPDQTLLQSMILRVEQKIKEVDKP